MPRGARKYFDLYNPETDQILHKVGVAKASMLLQIHYTRLYDIANLRQSIDGIEIRYYEKKVTKHKFYCQLCGKHTTTKPYIYEDDFIGRIKLCSQKCHLEFSRKRK